MPSDLSILNDALTQLKQPTVADVVGESLTIVASRVLAILPAARQAVLERHGWLCALAYTTLVADAALSNWKYDAGYNLPGDALRVWMVDGDPCNTKWEAGTVAPARKVIWANGTGDLDIAYVRDLPSAAMSPNLADAIAWELAARCCGGVTGDSQLAVAIERAAGNRLAWAVGVDGTQEGGQDTLVGDVVAGVRASVM
jgi:hypothetical protein